MKILLVSNKSLFFDTRVKEIQNLLIRKYNNFTYLDILSPYGKKIDTIFYSNFNILKIFFEKKNFKHNLAYLSDTLSIYKCLTYIILGGKYILDIHDYEHDRAPYGKNKFSIFYHINIFLLKFALKKATAVFTVSNLMKRYFQIEYKIDNQKIFTLYNSFYLDECICQKNHSKSILNANQDNYKICVIGKQSKFRGTEELINTIIKACRMKIPKKKLSFAILKIGSDINKFNDINTKKKDSAITEIDTSPLCQKCINDIISSSDLCIHAYKPTFANARHAVPNKLFSFINYSNSHLIFCGDFECKNILNKIYPKEYFTWISSHSDWHNILDKIYELVDKKIELEKKSQLYFKKEKNSFEEFNKDELNNLYKLLSNA